ncbi:LysE family translocator [Brachybacterium squillarum]|uniref:LysE family translocator n=1 Tax=Brachybacterium squillarum TaxID=661979 RepID=UPI0002629B73|nr:LysE family transporter [Brachybacterium squillarum]
MEQFLAVALAHALALLIPGVDFVLIVRTALERGAARASLVCLGIALAHAAIIALAFTGVALVQRPVVLDVLQLAGGVFLLWMAWRIARAPSHRELTLHNPSAPSRPRSAASAIGAGAAVAALNPKNLLFYLALSAALGSATTAVRLGYGVWMVAVVLGGDLLIALVLGRGRGTTTLRRALPWINRLAALALAIVGAAMILRLLLAAA